MNRMTFGSAVDTAANEDFNLVLVHNFCITDIDFATTATILNKNYGKEKTAQAYKERYLILLQTGVIDQIHASSIWLAEVGKLHKQAQRQCQNCKI